MKTKLLLLIALALVGCSDDNDGTPIVQEPDAGVSGCDNPVGAHNVTIVWGQGTCVVPAPTAVVDVAITRAASDYAVHSSVGDGTAKAGKMDGVCTLRFELSNLAAGTSWVITVRPDDRSTTEIGGGLFTTMTPSANCIQAFTVTHYEDR